MHTVINALKDYVNKVLGLDAAITDSGNTRNHLAAYLANQYDFYMFKADNHDFLLVFYSGENNQNPSVIRNNLNAIRERTGLLPIYACKTLSKDVRRDLISYKVSFIIPNQQLYLPNLGIYLKERIAKQQKRKTRVTPNAQLTVLSAILSQQIEKFTVSRLAEGNNYSVASASRIIREFQAIGAMACEPSGKELNCRWTVAAKALWVLVLPYLSSPVRSTYLVRDTTGELDSLSFAGLTALASYSSIAEPKIPVRACSQTYFMQLKHANAIQFLEYETTDAVELEVWTYNPLAVSHSKWVDQLSLYLSLKDDPDDRTQICLKEMLEAVTW